MNPKEPKGVVYEQDGGYSPVVFWVTVLIALFIHATLFLTLGDRNINMLTDFKRILAEQGLLPAPVEPIRADIVPMDAQEDPFPYRPEAAADPYDVDMDAVLDNLPTDAPPGLTAPPRSDVDLSQNEGNPAIEPPELPEQNIAEITPWVPREEILAAEREIVFDDIVPLNPVEIMPLDRMNFAPDVAPEYIATADIAQANRIGRPAYVPPEPVKTAEIQSADALAPTAARMPDAIDAGPEAAPETAAKKLVEVPEEVAPAIPIENVLNANVSVFKPRRADGYQYFQIDVLRKDRDVLPPLKRDVLLVQDASGSLGYERLGLCKRAFNKAVASLKPDDRFNILSFTTENAFCFGRAWQSPDPAAKIQAAEFIAALKSEGNTDIFNAVKGVLDLPRDPGRVMLVLLVSDGVATSGQIQRDSEIISEFSKLNGGAASVFNLGVSRRSNEFLLSMLSFQNRGGPAAIVSDRFDIEREVGSILSSVSNPVLSGVAFMFGSDSGAVVAPKMSTNLYLDRPMRLFGRAPIGEKSVVFQARGEAGAKKYDMVFDLDLSGAPDGGEDIQDNWARTRMYDLVSEYAVSPAPALVNEMDSIGRRFGIPIPFKNRIF